MVTRSLFWIVILIMLSVGIPSVMSPCFAQGIANQEPELIPGDSSDDSKSVDELIEEAEQLFQTKQPIDARAKLQKALAKAPEDYRIHMMLGTYYLGEVGHFQMAYRYLRTAEMLFTKQFGTDLDGSLKVEAHRQHARLLFLLAEARLNLDDYQGSLDTLNRYEKLYWDDWFPGSKAWVLMKLKRIDEAIRVAQGGIFQGGEPTRTWNILGILLSLKNSRELSLQAFSRAVRSEFAMGGSGGAATPMNNAGEVYNELFQDRMAEAAWLSALDMVDGCEHILPSLNLAIMYTNELRLLGAERVLSDFESCFANHASREDTEHRALLALARGRIALHQGDPSTALNFISAAAERQQWFGKIGTDPNDLKFAASISLASALKARAIELRDMHFPGLVARGRASVEARWLELRAWWLRRKAREIGIDSLESLEDLSIRNTDAMVEYPTLGGSFEELPSSSLGRKLSRLEQDDSRAEAKSYYLLYLGTNLRAKGEDEEAISLLETALKGFRPFDRLARAETIGQIILAKKDRLGFFKKENAAEMEQRVRLSEELYQLSPSRLRFLDIRLPIGVISVVGSDPALTELQDLFDHDRFEILSRGTQARYKIVLESGQLPSIALWDTILNTPVVVQQGSISGEDERAELFNGFLSKLFQSKMDPASEPAPKAEFLKKVMAL